jgi:hypothetical protein
MVLLPADILCWAVSPQAPVMGRLIGYAERKIGDQVGPWAFYHCAIVSANISLMYASRPPKIDLYPIPDPLPAYIEVRRTKVKLTDDQIKAIFYYADSRKGNIYPFLGVITFGWLSGNLEFCSQYVEDSYANGQVVLAPDIRFTTPDDISNSGLLYLAGNV